MSHYEYRVRAARDGSEVVYTPEYRGLKNQWAGAAWFLLPNSRSYYDERPAWEAIYAHAERVKSEREAEAKVNAYKVRQYSEEEILAEKYKETADEGE